MIIFTIDNQLVMETDIGFFGSKSVNRHRFRFRLTGTTMVERPSASKWPQYYYGGYNVPIIIVL